MEPRKNLQDEDIKTLDAVSEKNQNILFRRCQVAGGRNHSPIDRAGDRHWNCLRGRLLCVLLHPVLLPRLYLERDTGRIHHPVGALVARVLLVVDPPRVLFHVHPGRIDGRLHGRARGSPLHNITGPLRGIHSHEPCLPDGLCIDVFDIG